MPIRIEVAAAAARAWLVDPALMYPWTSGVVALVFFLIGALAARRGSLPRTLVRIAALFCIIFVLAVVLGRSARCT